MKCNICGKPVSKFGMMVKNFTVEYAEARPMFWKDLEKTTKVPDYCLGLYHLPCFNRAWKNTPEYKEWKKSGKSST